ncbi:response regulator [Acidisoma silvae]|uniref:Response regulator n=1 Tax=Acidisoma silvae TaxID=2802396 RepID=A0A963YWF6_9PROT|nr:response regulator [Acidisoma silvae]MCB8878406.1 response regulator [Acidisoma silvae]
MKRLLFVEDEETIRFLVSEFFRDEDYEVTEAGNADDAMCFLRRSPTFDILVTDVQMPGSRDGLDVVAYARAISPKIAIVVVSGYADRLFERLAALKQPCEFLSKPFNLSEMTNSIERATSARGLVTATSHGLLIN